MGGEGFEEGGAGGREGGVCQSVGYYGLALEKGWGVHTSDLSIRNRGCGVGRPRLSGQSEVLA